MTKIVLIELTGYMVAGCWYLGRETSYKSGKFITEIRDMSMEFEDSIHVAYDIFANGKLYKSIINLPVQVEYEIEGGQYD